MKIKELKKKYLAKGVNELKKDLLELEKELVHRRLEAKMAKLKQTHLIKLLRYQIALIKTLIKEKELKSVEKGETNGR